MDYEQKYKEALEKLRDFYRDYDTVSHLIDVKEELANLFPELKESEDERIRKALLEMVHDTTGDSLWVDYNVHKEEMLAWLEKQGEQKPANEEMIETLRTEYEKGRADAIAEMQKGWSEEDETRLQVCIDCLQAKSLMGKVDTVMTNWLKSLKERCTWKPSDEQMKALHNLNLTGNLSYAGQGQVLIKLYNDLKKLTE